MTTLPEKLDLASTHFLVKFLRIAVTFYTENQLMPSSRPPSPPPLPSVDLPASSPVDDLSESSTSTAGALARHDEHNSPTASVSVAKKSPRFLPTNAALKFREVLSHYDLKFHQIESEDPEHTPCRWDDFTMDIVNQRVICWSGSNLFKPNQNSFCRIETNLPEKLDLTGDHFLVGFLRTAVTFYTEEQLMPVAEPPPPQPQPQPQPDGSYPASPSMVNAIDHDAAAAGPVKPPIPTRPIAPSSSASVAPHTLGRRFSRRMEANAEALAAQARLHHLLRNRPLLKESYCQLPPTPTQLQSIVSLIELTVNDRVTLDEQLNRVELFLAWLHEQQLAAQYNRLVIVRSIDEMLFQLKLIFAESIGYKEFYVKLLAAICSAGIAIASLIGPKIAT